MTFNDGDLSCGDGVLIDTVCERITLSTSDCHKAVVCSDGDGGGEGVC